MTTKTKITHNTPIRHVLGTVLDVNASHFTDVGSNASTSIRVPDETTSVRLRGRDGRITVEAISDSDTEPEPIPMCDMKPGDKGVVATVADEAAGEGLVGDIVVMTRDPQFSVRLTDGFYLIACNYTVHTLQPGDSLLIEVVDDKPDAPDDERPDGRDVDDDQFERLPNGARMMCTACAVRFDKTRCRDGGPVTLPFDERGINGRAHPCFIVDFPVEPETLDHALRHSDADAMMAAAERLGDGTTEAAWLAMRDIVPSILGLPGDCIIATAYRATSHYPTRCSAVARAIVKLRDRLGLFKEEK